MASLLVIQGPDQGKRFALEDVCGLGRDESNPVRLLDQEISRRHAEVRPTDGHRFKLVDLGSANGTYVNGQPIDVVTLHVGDRIQVGSTILVFESDRATQPDLTARVDLLNQANPDDRSAIIRSVATGPDFPLQTPGNVGDWLRTRLGHLSVMYRATQAISHIDDVKELLPRILQLVFESVSADRAALLLLDSSGQLEPEAVRWRTAPPPDERLTISRTIIEHVRQSGQGVITTDAPTDSRFEPSHSIVDFAIREALCVPVQGRHSTLGVLYADAQGDLSRLNRENPAERTRFTQEDLALLVAVGHQAGLAIENSRFYQAKLQAERLAAVGQTITTLSHHIKNILQGLKSGSYLIDLGLKQEDGPIIRRGWGILEKNQNRIYELVMDMLTFSKEREPAFELGNLNDVVAEVVELIEGRASEQGVGLSATLDPGLPGTAFDLESIHRAILNIALNALDAVAGTENAAVQITTRATLEPDEVRISVTDNGSGIDLAQVPQLFQPFVSTKGTSGTGLGLAVSEKIAREHGGRIEVQSEPGQGACFTLILPVRALADDHGGIAGTLPEADQIDPEPGP